VTGKYDYASELAALSEGFCPSLSWHANPRGSRLMDDGYCEECEVRWVAEIAMSATGVTRPVVTHYEERL
jgi:hypothetical protein